MSTKQNLNFCWFTLIHPKYNTVFKKFLFKILAAFKAGKIAANPFAHPPPAGMKIPPPGMAGKSRNCPLHSKVYVKQRMNFMLKVKFK